MKLIKSIFFSILIIPQVFSQITIKSHFLKENDTCLNCIIDTNVERQVLLFYPTAKFKNSYFEEKSQELIASFKETNVKPTLIQFIYFKQNLKTDVKGLKYFSNSGDTLFINYLKCFITGIDTNLLIRSKSIMPINFEIKKVFSDSHLNEISIRDTSVCIDLLNRLSFYNDFILESVSPKFSDKEKIEILTSLTNDLIRKIEENETQIKDLMKIVESMNYCIDEQANELQELRLEKLKNKKHQRRNE
jgi:hypothetical protein